MGRLDVRSRSKKRDRAAGHASRSKKRDRAATHHGREGDDQDDGEGHEAEDVAHGAPQRLHLTGLERAACGEQGVIKGCCSGC